MIPARAVYRAWKLCRKQDLDVFRLTSARGLLEVRGWQSLGLPESEAALRELLEAVRAIELSHREARPDRQQARLVATVPPAFGVSAGTREVALSLIQTATTELLLAGYAIRDQTFIHVLCDKGLRGIAVTVVSDRTEDDARRLLEAWPADAAPLRAFRGIEAASGHSLMHAKAIVADRDRALVGSANFTTGGFRNNIEVGVEVRGPVATDLAKLFDDLIAAGWIEAVNA